MSEIPEVPAGENLDRAVAEAYAYYQGNVRKAGESVFDITLAARNGASERELLELSLKCLDKMLDEPVGEHVLEVLRKQDPDRSSNA